MMNVQKFLQANGNNFNKLNDAFGIIVKKYDDLVVLNYDQIESPKTDPIVVECRGLIMDLNGNVVSRSFDRFFNLGEAPETQAHLDWNKVQVFEKVDGSLIKIYHYKDKWHISTRGTAFAESSVNGFDKTFHELTLRTADLTDEQFQFRANDLLDKDVTYIFEVACMENRVVTRYDQDQMVYLGSRHKDGSFLYDIKVFKMSGNIRCAKSFNLDSVEACAATVQTLGNLEEGFVLWQDGKPVCKVKSPTYVAVHRIRGEGLTPNRIAELVLTGEEDEYLAYFPEDGEHFTPYVEAYKNLKAEIDSVYNQNKEIEAQKDFALAVTKHPFSAALFQARKTGQCPVHCFNQSRLNYRIDILRSLVG